MEFHPQFDSENSLTTPHINRLTSDTLPSVFVGSFSLEVIEAFAAESHVSIVAREHALDGWKNVYRWHDETSDFLFGQLPVGAGGTINHLEEVITLGIKKVVVFGTVGLLETTDSEVFIPRHALRDEGISQHYTSDTTGVLTNEIDRVNRLAEFFKREEIPHEIVTTWTTDAFYRETPKRIAAAKKAGARVVEMEMAALFAWSAFREIEFYSFMHRADSLSTEIWDEAVNVGFLF